jgi:NADPH:quinone reductase-like Zn-dependent oxidoreductase
MTHAIRINEFGGPENLEFVEVELGDPGPGQARVAHTAVGLNYIDTHIRTGMYPVQLPSGLGGEAAGTVVSVGEGVEHVAPGDRIAYASSVPPQAYSEECVMDAKALLKLPDGIDDETAAAMMLKGLTSWYLLRRTYEVQAGDWILLYAAAGGVGTIAAQWAKHLGARVIGVVSTEEKREAALAHGCEEVLLSDSNIVEAVRDLTNGDGVPVVYDPVGKDTLYTSLDCLKSRGLLVSFGNASGPVDCLPLLELMKRGSLYVTRPALPNYIATREDLEWGAGELMSVVGGGHVKIEIGQRFALADAADAHRALEARRTTGSTILVP